MSTPFFFCPTNPREISDVLPLLEEFLFPYDRSMFASLYQDFGSLLSPWLSASSTDTPQRLVSPLLLSADLFSESSLYCSALKGNEIRTPLTWLKSFLFPYNFPCCEL